MQVEEGWEEMFDYVFPEDEAAKPNLKLMEKVKAWKKAKEELEQGKQEDRENQETERDEVGGESNSKDGNEERTKEEESNESERDRDTDISESSGSEEEVEKEIENE